MDGLRSRAKHQVAAADLAARINHAHEACCRAAGDALTHALNAGELLAQAKAQCQHGQWSQWLADNFSGSDRTARAYMRIASHREEIEAKRQTTADLTLERALNYIAPRQRKEPDTAAQLQAHERTIEDGLASSVEVFDDLKRLADAFGKSHEEVYQSHYADCAEPGGDLPTFDEYREHVEQTRSAPWFDDALRRVQAEKINKAESAAQNTELTAVAASDWSSLDCDFEIRRETMRWWRTCPPAERHSIPAILRRIADKLEERNSKMEGAA